jgi:hypothetical protein
VTTWTDDKKLFQDLLRESREIMERYMQGQQPDILDPTVKAHLTPEESLVYEQMSQGAMEARDELFHLGARYGLTEKEITVALLRPIAHTLRPTLPVGGCNCRRCSARRELR